MWPIKKKKTGENTSSRIILGDKEIAHIIRALPTPVEGQVWLRASPW